MAVQDYCNNTEQMVYAARFSALALAIFALSLFHAYEPLQAATATFHCVNTASGTAWDINVDYDRATANSFPAEITASRIFWKDTKEGATYSLDRKTGDLTLAVPSSTGGALWFHKCRGE